MRFSYIDSQGKEIEVDSVESLALRIQLGAIKPDTRMYDAVADRWAPAEEHPVFRSLSRGEEIDEEEVVAIGQEVAAAEEAAEAPREAAEPKEADEADEGGGPEEVDEPEEVGEAEEAAPDEGIDVEEQEAARDPLGLGFDVSVTEEGPEGEARREAPEESHREVESAKAGSGGVESEPTESEPVASGSPGDVSAESEAAEADAPDLDEGSREDAPTSSEPEITRPAWLDEGEALWQEPEDGGTTRDDGPGAMGHREALEEDPADPRRKMPEWAVDPVESEVWEEEEESPPAEESREPSRLERSPAPPTHRRPVHRDDRRRGRSRGSRIPRVAQVAGLILVLGAVAGYFLVGSGEQVETAGEEAGESAEPVLPPEQWRAMATAADRAWSDVLEEFRSAVPGYGLPARPPDAWLDGIYLSNAGEYPEVAEYWNGMVETVEDLRSRESALYFQHLNQHLERMAASPGDPAVAGISIPSGAVPHIITVARDEYERSAPARDSVYQQIRDVGGASLALHDLLVAREEDIVYEPYSDPQVSRDPVLEAVPADSVLRAEMNDALDRVIAAINENGLPRPITTASVFNHLVTELGRTETASETPPPPGDQPMGAS